MKLAHTDVIIEGYEDPALEGETISFSCPLESMLTGPNSSTCIGNGEWEPDPGEFECTGAMGATSATTLGIP